MAPVIGSETALCGVVLHPAGHTRSPAMHNAAFEALGIDAVYLAFDVSPSALPDAIAGLRALGIRQLAVSIPHKIAVMRLVDAVDETARAIGAVNTVTRDGERLVGTNSDWQGVAAALRREAPDGVAGAKAIVLGAGGAARAAVYGLLREGADVTVLNRTPQRARELADALGASAGGSLEELEAVGGWDVLVNTTSVGLKEDLSPVPARAIPRDAIVLDAVYDPAETRLLREAAARGARTVAGKWWLVHQAAAQLAHWTGRDAPIEIMARAFDAAGDPREAAPR